MQDLPGAPQGAYGRAMCSLAAEYLHLLNTGTPLADEHVIPDELRIAVIAQQFDVVDIAQRDTEPPPEGAA